MFIRNTKRRSAILSIGTIFSDKYITLLSSVELGNTVYYYLFDIVLAWKRSAI